MIRAWRPMSQQQELARCQRYFQTYSPPPLRGTVNASTLITRMGMVLPVPMRSSPTCTLISTLPFYNGISTGTATSINANYSTPTVAEFDLNTPATGFTAGQAAIVYQGAGGQMNFDAEL